MAPFYRYLYLGRCKMESKKEHVRIMVVDDHAIVRHGLTSVLEKGDLYKVCCEAENISMMIEHLEAMEIKPHLVMIDYMLPDGDGASGCRYIKNKYPEIKVLIVSALSDYGTIKEAVMSGADGYLVKNIDRKTILETVEKVLDGKSVFEEDALKGLINAVKSNVIEGQATLVLSKMEENILDGVALGMTNKEIGMQLFIAEKTVRNYLSRIMRKLDVNNRTEAALVWNQKNKQ